MSDLLRLLEAANRGDQLAATDLLPLVYDELRKLAAVRMATENPGQTLNPTALVHEAYVRLVESHSTQHWKSRGHFFAAAAESMRRILVDAARRRKSLKRGGGHERQPLDEATIAAPEVGEDILALDEALIRLAAKDREAAELVKLRFFAGLTSEQAAEMLGISARTADTTWIYAKTFLLKELQNV